MRTKVVLKDSNTSHFLGHWIRSLVLGCSGPGSRSLVSGTSVWERPREWSSWEIQDGTFEVASGAGSRMNWVSSIWAWKALVAYVDDKLGFVHDLVVGRNDHADGYPTLDLGCSKRMGIFPLPGDVGMRSP